MPLLNPGIVRLSADWLVSAFDTRFHDDVPAGRIEISYRVNDPPPSWAFVNAVHVNVTVVFPGIAANAPTAYAAVAGVSEPDADDAGPVPAELIAATVTVYAVPLTRPVIVHGDTVHDDDVTVVPDDTGVPTTWYAEMATPPVNPGAANPTVIDCDDAEADVSVGAVASAGTTWNARDTSDAAAYCASPACDATTSHVPTASTVTTPRVDTEHAAPEVPYPEVPEPSTYDTVRLDDAVAPIDTDDDPNAALDGCANVIV